MRQALIDWRAYESLESRASALPAAPLLSLVLRHYRRSIVAFGLVDSGSDQSCLPLRYAHRLGVELEGDIRPVEVLGTVVEVRTAYCELRIPTALGVMEFHSVEFSVPESEEGSDVVILGQSPLFREVEIRFQAWANRFGIAKRPPGPAMHNVGTTVGRRSRTAHGRARRARPQRSA